MTVEVYSGGLKMKNNAMDEENGDEVSLMLTNLKKEISCLREMLDSENSLYDSQTFSPLLAQKN